MEGDLPSSLRSYEMPSFTLIAYLRLCLPHMTAEMGRGARMECRRTLWLFSSSGRGSYMTTQMGGCARLECRQMLQTLYVPSESFK